MKNENIYLALLAVMAAGLLIYALSGLFAGQPDKSSNPVSQESAGMKTILTGSTEAGDVSIELTPEEVKDGQLAVDISVNTHSVSLSDYDLKQITTLEYDAKIIFPSSAPSMAGHHVSGQLTFDVNREISAFTIRIRGIPSVEERVFSWE